MSKSTIMLLGGLFLVLAAVCTPAAQAQDEFTNLPILSGHTRDWRHATIGARRADYLQHIRVHHPDVSAVLACIAEVESAGYWYPRIVNFQDGRAKGLTQFMDGTWARVMVPGVVRPQGYTWADRWNPYHILDASAALLRGTAGSPYEFATYPYCRQAGWSAVGTLSGR